MRVIAFIDNPDAVEKILRHLDLWGRPETGGLRRLESVPVSSLMPPAFPMLDYDIVITD